jgi:hypothetical protein
MSTHVDLMSSSVDQIWNQVGMGKVDNHSAPETFRSPWYGHGLHCSDCSNLRLSHSTCHQIYFDIQPYGLCAMPPMVTYRRSPSRSSLPQSLLLLRNLVVLWHVSFLLSPYNQAEWHPCQWLITVGWTKGWNLETCCPCFRATWQSPSRPLRGPPHLWSSPAASGFSITPERKENCGRMPLQLSIKFAIKTSSHNLYSS